MISYLIIATVALLASLLTFFSGFGLGTLLLPAFALFFSIDIAIALTGVVHLLSNVFKFVLVGKNINKTVLLRFGITAIIGAAIGAYLLSQFHENQILTSWNNGKYNITWLRIIMASVMIFFALFELIPTLKNLNFDKKYLPFGGFLSGFFGGLSGHQGALRSAFLIRYGLSKEALIATGVAIACLIDVTRLSLYYERFLSENISKEWRLLLVATFSAFLGAYFGNILLKKVTIEAVQKIVASGLILFAIVFGLGII
jgi:uncharacterized protein